MCYLCDMTFRISLLLILITGFVLSCSTGPEFERDNLNDPENGQFTPDVGNLALSIDSSKDVTLIWNDISDFEDGFIIQKSYENKESFFDLDTLPANSSRYIDSTKKLAVDTFYRVRSFSGSSDSLGSTEIDKLFLNTLESITVPDVPGNEISISWEVNPTGFTDAYLIEKKINNDSWEVVDTVDNSKSNYVFKELNNTFYIDIRVSSLLSNHKNKLVKINNHEISQVALNTPYNLNADFQNEAEAVFTWNSKSSFTKNFILYQRTKKTPHSDYGDWAILDTLFSSSNTMISSTPDEYYQFSIRALYNNELSERSASFSKVILSSPPEISRLETISDTEAKLFLTDTNFLEDNARFPSYSFTLQQRNESGNYTTIKIIDKDTDFFIVKGLDANKEYNFRVKSYSSFYNDFSIEFDLNLLKTNTFNAKSDPFYLNNAWSLNDNILYIGTSKIDLVSLNEQVIPPFGDKFITGLDANNSFIYYADGTNFKVEKISSSDFSNISSLSTSTTTEFVNIELLENKNEVLLFLTKNEPTISVAYIQKWDSNMENLLQEVSLLNSPENNLCHYISDVELSPSENELLVLCGNNSIESSNSEKGNLLKINPNQLTDITEILENDYVRDTFFDSENEEYFYYITQDTNNRRNKRVVKYHLPSGNKISSIAFSGAGLYDIRKDHSNNLIYIIATQKSLSSSNSYLLTLDSNTLEFINEFEVPGRYFHLFLNIEDSFLLFGYASGALFQKTSNWLLK